MASKKYEAYKAGKIEEKITGLIGYISPAWALKRIINREKAHRFSYIAAQPNPARKNSNPNSSGETQRGSRQKMQIMWNAIALVENSGLCSSILDKLANYICGSIRYQPRTGVSSIDKQYRDYIKAKFGKSADYTGRFTMRQMLMLDVRSIALKGDVGTNLVREGNELYLQGIEADRIGDPYDSRISNTFVRGIIINSTGVIDGYKLYYRDRMSGRYIFDFIAPARNRFGLPNFFFSMNPITYDDYRGISCFKTAIDNAHLLEQIKRWELQALAWAASQSGIYYTKSGALPEQLPFDTSPTPSLDQNGTPITSFTVNPNTVTAVGIGEDIKMFQHDRPSPNVMALYRDIRNDICNGTNLSQGFVCGDIMGISGPGVRMLSAQDKRTIQMWQSNLQEDKLDPAKTMLLGNAIATGQLPFHPRWNEGTWYYPPYPTIDVGRESDANLAEYESAVTTGADIAAEDSKDIMEIQEQCGLEAANIMDLAIGIADTLSKKYKTQIEWREVLPMIRRGGDTIMSPIFEAARAKQLDAQAKAAKKAELDKVGVTGGPVDLP